MSSENDIFRRDPSEEDESDLQPTISGAVLSSSDWTAETILSQMRRGHIQLNPSFQRREAWTDQRKSQFIESLFLGLPIPQLVLAESLDERGKYIVIDGKQRLLALRRFAAAPNQTEDDGFDPLHLEGLKVRSELNGHRLVDLVDDLDFAEDVAAFENQTIRTVVVRNWKTEAYLYTVFLRLNTGSVPLSPQELRQALHPGPFLDFVDRYSAASEMLQSALGIESPDFRMRDAEILIRFFAFSEFLTTYNGNLKAFLDKTAESLNKGWNRRASELESLAKRCDSAIATTIDIFGEDAAFTRWNHREGAYEHRFNRAVFDIMTFYFKDPKIARAAKARKTRVRTAFQNLCALDPDFRDAIQTTTKTVEATHMRLRKWGDVLKAATDVPIGRPRLVKNRIQV